MSPVTTTLLYTVCSAFPWISFSCVTVYVAVITYCSPDAKLSIVRFPSITIPSSCSSITMFVNSTLPVLVTVIVYSITSPAFTSASLSMLTPSLLMSTTSFTTSISAVGTSFSSVSFPPTVAVFVISLLISSTSTVNCTDAFPPSCIAGTFTFVHDKIVFPVSSSSKMSAPSADTSDVPSGTVSWIKISPAISPVFIAVIVYIIWSPSLAISTSLSFLIITLDFSFLIIAVCVSLLSSPFATAVFTIVPSTFSFTFTVNETIAVFSGSTVTIHLIPTTLLFSSTIVSGSLTWSPSLIDTKVVFCGILSVTSMFSTASVPLFFTVIWYVSSFPAYTRFSLPVSEITDFCTSKSGASTFKFATVDATATLVGVHQSQ